MDYNQELPKRKFNNLTGKTFDRLTVVKFNGRNKFGQIIWQCECSCDNNVVDVPSHSLLSGHTRSCGCLGLETKRTNGITHGMYKTPEYTSWCSMKSRCNDPTRKSYKNYGGRGIKVCEKWDKSFDDFINDIGLQPKDGQSYSIDRIDNDGDYTPENCKWSTDIEQANNRGNNHDIEYNGETHTASEWARIINIPVYTIFSRLQDEWDIERIMTTPHKQANFEYSQRIITCDGFSGTAKEWSIKIGIKTGTLIARLRSGWTDEETIKTPLKTKG